MTIENHMTIKNNSGDNQNDNSTLKMTIENYMDNRIPTDKIV